MGSAQTRKLLKKLDQNLPLGCSANIVLTTVERKCALNIFLLEVFCATFFQKSGKNKKAKKAESRSSPPILFSLFLICAKYASLDEADFNAEGVFFVSSAYLVRQRRRTRLKNTHKIEIRKDFYKKPAQLPITDSKAGSFIYLAYF